MATVHAKWPPALNPSNAIRSGAMFNSPDQAHRPATVSQLRRVLVRRNPVVQHGADESVFGNEPRERFALVVRQPRVAATGTDNHRRVRLRRGRRR